MCSCSCYLKVVLVLALSGFCSCAAVINSVSTNSTDIRPDFVLVLISTNSTDIRPDFVTILRNIVEQNATENLESDNSTLRFELPCDTPNNDIGYCTGIKSCTVLLKALYKPKSKAFLIASRCSDKYDTTNPKVCCGKWGHFVKDEEKKNGNKGVPPSFPDNNQNEFEEKHTKVPEMSYNKFSTYLNVTPVHVVGELDTIDVSTLNQDNNSEVDEGYDDINPLPKKCGMQKQIMGGRIFGGEEAQLGEFPWLARIIHENRDGYRSFGCAGFLITSRFVMTAAHCLLSETRITRGNISSVLLGEHNVKTDIDCTRLNTFCAPPTVEIRVLHEIAHPAYDMHSKSHPDDIGLLHLAKPVVFSEYIQPICLHTKKSYVVYNYYVSGWGKTESRQVSNVKMKLELPRYEHESCVSRYNQIGMDITENQICAGGLKGKDSCTGDSGGPLMMSPNGTVWFAAGLVSYGVGCGKEGWPGVYTNIPMYIPWIKNTIREYAGARQARRNRRNRFH